MTDETKGMLLGLLGVVSFGLTLPVTRFVIPYFDPVFVGLGRAVVAALVATFLLLFTKQAIPSKSQALRLFITGTDNKDSDFSPGHFCVLW